jgi:hypothetical protein
MCSVELLTCSGYMRDVKGTIGIWWQLPRIFSVIINEISTKQWRYFLNIKIWHGPGAGASPATVNDLRESVAGWKHRQAPQYPRFRGWGTMEWPYHPPCPSLQIYTFPGSRPCPCIHFQLERNPCQTSQPRLEPSSSRETALLLHSTSMLQLILPPAGHSGSWSVWTALEPSPGPQQDTLIQRNILLDSYQLHTVDN